jgi:hypothetical protein
VGRIAADHLAELEDPLGVVSLTKGDAASILAHLEAEVETEKPGSLMLNLSFICALNFFTSYSSTPVMMRSST